MPQVILISQVPLPYSQIGSWTTLYQNYLADNHQIDYIVCEKPEYFFPEVKYCIVENTNFLKIQKIFLGGPRGKNVKNFLSPISWLLFWFPAHLSLTYYF